MEAPKYERYEQELAPMKRLHPLALLDELIVLAVPVGIFTQEDFLPDICDSDRKAKYHLHCNTDLSDYLLECLFLYAGLRCICDHRNLKKRSQERRIDEEHRMNQEANVHDVLHVCPHSSVLAIHWALFNTCIWSYPIAGCQEPCDDSLDTEVQDVLADESALSLHEWPVAHIVQVHGGLALLLEVLVLVEDPSIASLKLKERALGFSLPRMLTILKEVPDGAIGTFLYESWHCCYKDGLAWINLILFTMTDVCL